MSGGPPHHPHGRQQPSSNQAWNHLQVPNYFPSRQLQHAHMSNEHPLLHQPTWHTPTTEPVKTMPHSHLFNLEQMISDRSFQRHAPGVDLSLQRNGSQNGELPTSPISLSVRDTNKINSLPAGAIDIQAVELTKSLSPGMKSKPLGSPGLHSVAPLLMGSPGLKSTSPGLKSGSPGTKSNSPGLKTTSPGLKTSSPSLKVSGSNLLSVGGHGLLATNPGIVCTSTGLIMTPSLQTTSFGSMGSPMSLSSSQLHPSLGGSNLTITPAYFPAFGPGMKGAGPVSPGQQNSPKSTKRPAKRVDSILERLNPNVDKGATLSDKVDKTEADKGQSVIVQASSGSTNDDNSNSSSVVTNARDDDVVSPYSANEDSMDSSKSRRKRKPSKTVKLTKEEDKIEPEQTENNNTSINDKKGGKQDRNLVDVLEKDKEEVQRRRSGSAPPRSPVSPQKPRRKTSSECETIASIAAMVEQTASKEELSIKIEKEDTEIKNRESQKEEERLEDKNAVSVSVIRDPSKEKSDVADNRTSTPNPQKSNQKCFVEVENKLQEMFAGITDETDSKILNFSEDSKNLDLEEGKTNSTFADSNIPPIETSVTSTSNDVSPISSTNRKRKGKSNQSKTSDSLTSEPSTPKRKKSDKKIKNTIKKEIPPNSNGKSIKKPAVNSKPLANKVDNFKDVYAYDSGSNASSNKSRGPYIQIQGPRDSPVSINVINTPSNEEDPDKKSNKNKKYHDDSEYRYKVQSRGLHCSTLSNKYDAQTRDASWICAFCKRGPHATDPNLPGPSPFMVSNVNIPPPGDLFGPYIITSNSPEFERRIEDPFDKEFRSKKVARAVDANLPSTSKPMGKKSKRKHTDSSDSNSEIGSITLGITETKDKTYEVWMHEDCVVWSPGVYLIGSKIVGLEEAVWTSCNVTCMRCSYKGANVCCVKRGCTNVMHVGCARLAGWNLDEDTYRAVCTNHAEG